MGKANPLRTRLNSKLSKLLLSLRIKYAKPIPHEPCVPHLLTFIDSHPLLLALKKIREKIGVKNPPFISYRELILLIFEDARNLPHLPKLLETPKDSLGRLLSNPVSWETIINKWAPADSKQRRTLNEELFRLSSSYEGRYFSYELAEQAVLLGLVGWGMKPANAINENYPLRFPSHVIHVFPYTQESDVIKQYKYIIDNWYQIKRKRSKGEKINEEIPRIIKYHNFYWNYLETRSPTKVVAEARSNILSSVASRYARNYLNMLLPHQV